MTGPSFGGAWTRQKLEILRRYLDTYTTALKEQPFELTYVDAFAGAGVWSPESTYDLADYGEYREMVEGSAAIALNVADKSFDQLIFIEKDEERSTSLRTLQDNYSGRNIQVVSDDSNVALPRFCKLMGDFDRAVVFLDPFATQVNWSTVEAVAETRKIDCWILFPLMAIARMMPIEQKPTPALSAQLDRIFGSREHWQGLYRPSPQLSMFDIDLGQQRSSGSEQIAELYRTRLESTFCQRCPDKTDLAKLYELTHLRIVLRGQQPCGSQTGNTYRKAHTRTLVM